MDDNGDEFDKNFTCVCNVNNITSISGDNCEIEQPAASIAVNDDDDKEATIGGTVGGMGLLLLLAVVAYVYWAGAGDRQLKREHQALDLILAAGTDCSRQEQTLALFDAIHLHRFEVVPTLVGTGADASTRDERGSFAHTRLVNPGAMWYRVLVSRWEYCSHRGQHAANLSGSCTSWRS